MFRRKPKGPTARRIAKRRRAEGPVAKAVREKCVERDGYCRVETASYGNVWAEEPIENDMPSLREASLCDGPSEWAHLGEKQRAKTRNMAPEDRHTTAGSAMLCKLHHDRYDGRRRPRLKITPLTDKGADGPLNFSQGAL